MGLGLESVVLGLGLAFGLIRFTVRVRQVAIHLATVKQHKHIVFYSEGSNTTWQSSTGRPPSTAADIDVHRDSGITATSSGRPYSLTLSPK